MLAPVVIVLVVAVVAVLALFWMLRWSKERGATAEALESAGTETLEYPVPPGQDPVVVLRAGVRGFHGEPRRHRRGRADPLPGRAEAARPLARAAIARADRTAIEHGAPLGGEAIRFRDEH